MNDLSIIIVNWNTKEELLRSLESIYQNKGKANEEIIVVDNGSQDGSMEELKKVFPSVLIIQNERNLGFAKAVNQGLQIASGRYFLLLNPDTGLKEGVIEELYFFMEKHPEIGLIGPQLLNDDGSKQNSIANFPSLATELFNKSLLRWLFPKHFPGKEEEYTEPIEVDSVIGACIMVRKKAIEEVGLLDEDYFLFFEETDWCYRMKKAGWKIYHVPKVKVFHFQGKSVEKEKVRSKVEYYRSRYLFFKKHKGKYQLLLLIIGLIIKLIIEFIFMGFSNLFTFFRFPKIRKRFNVYAYLLWWHLRGCPEGMGLNSLPA
ncbi:MAG: glycosyltransferase family 2 protein [Thermodesulfobacteriota bacterium]